MDDQTRSALTDVAAMQPRALLLFRTEGFVFNGSGGVWEKLAFTLYTMLVEAHEKCQAVLDDAENGS